MSQLVRLKTHDLHSSCRSFSILPVLKLSSQPCTSTCVLMVMGRAEVSGAADDSGRPQYLCSGRSISVRFSLIRHSTVRLEGEFAPSTYLHVALSYSCLYKSVSCFEHKILKCGLTSLGNTTHVSSTDGTRLFSLPDDCSGSVRTFTPWLLLKLPITSCHVSLMVVL